MLYLIWQTWRYYRFFSEHQFSFQKAAISRKCQLCLISMKIDILGYFDVAKFFPRVPFLSKWPQYDGISRNVNFVRFQWKFRSWGNLMWRTWWCYRNCFPSHHFLSPAIRLMMAYCYVLVPRWAIQSCYFLVVRILILYTLVNKKKRSTPMHFQWSRKYKVVFLCQKCTYRLSKFVHDGKET